MNLIKSQQHNALNVLLLAVVLLVAMHGTAQAAAHPSAQAGYPLDPPREIAWSAGHAGWSDVVEAFNHARTQESAALGLALPAFKFPTAEQWAGMSDGAKALWLINEERTARGLAPLQALEPNVNAVAQGYAEWLLANNQFDHDADGRSPWERLDANPAIGACHDFLGIAENLYFIASTEATSIPLVIEQAIYAMLYEDAGSAWGHRHAMLWTPYTENNGAADREGFLGVGHVHGGYTYDGTYYQSTDIIVMNFFDPCATWVTLPADEPEPTATATATPTATPTATSSPSPSASPTPTLSPTPSPEVTATPDAPVTPQPKQPPTPIEPTRTVSGQVTVSHDNATVAKGTGLVGVIIASDAGPVTVTDADGLFTLAGLSAGRHTLTSSKAGYTFVPASIEVDLSAGDLGGLTIASASGPSGTDLSFAIHLPLIRPD